MRIKINGNKVEIKCGAAEGFNFALFENKLIEYKLGGSKLQKVIF